MLNKIEKYVCKIQLEKMQHTLNLKTTVYVTRRGLNDYITILTS